MTSATALMCLLRPSTKHINARVITRGFPSQRATSRSILTFHRLGFEYRLHVLVNPKSQTNEPEYVNCYRYSPTLPLYRERIIPAMVAGVHLSGFSPAVFVCIQRSTFVRYETSPCYGHRMLELKQTETLTPLLTGPIHVWSSMPLQAMGQAQAARKSDAGCLVHFRNVIATTR